MIIILNINNILRINIKKDPKKVCSKCGKNNLALNNYKSIYNPIINLCSNKHCRIIHYLKEGTFFELFPKTPISVCNLICFTFMDN